MNSSGGLCGVLTVFRIGRGPSSSHTMGPYAAAETFAFRYPAAVSFTAELYGSLAATGAGHGTDRAVTEAFSPRPVALRWFPERELPEHPNGLRFSAHDASGKIFGEWEGYSVGGGAVRTASQPHTAEPAAYPHRNMAQILAWCGESKTLWDYIKYHEGDPVENGLRRIWGAMREALERGLSARGVLPGGLNLARRAGDLFRRVSHSRAESARTGLLSAYALAVAEENAAGGIVCTAPTCGSCGVVPAVLMFLNDRYGYGEHMLARSLGVAGLVGSLVKRNASISGAEVGCQGEIGTACAMAAAAAAYCLGGTSCQIEYAAEMGLEHHLGLTCDPVGGLVQIPCIERNAMAALRALDAAEYALLTDGSHRVPFDAVVAAMNATGRDLPPLYRETSRGGLALHADKACGQGKVES